MPGGVAGGTLIDCPYADQILIPIYAFRLALTVLPGSLPEEGVFFSACVAVALILLLPRFQPFLSSPVGFRS
jgi:hypothetical protein